MMAVLFGQDHIFFRDPPVNADFRIIPCYRAFGRGAIEVVALVLEDRFL